MIVKVTVGSILLGLSLTLQAEGSLSRYCPEADAEHMPLHREPPAWPHSAMMMCLEGTVVVEFTVSEDGRVRDASVIESTHPGIFDRAAITATESWYYRPSCEGGKPVAVQQRTALDFVFAEGLRSRCLPGARLLEGEALDLVASLAVLYSMLAESQLRPYQVDWLTKIEHALEPSFDGELGRVEQFHHDVIGKILATAQEQSYDPRYLSPFMLGRFAVPGSAIDPLSEEILVKVRQNTWAWVEALRSHSEWITERYAVLRREASMDPELLNVLVHGFLGDPNEGMSVQKHFVTAVYDLTEQLLDLLENPASDWTEQPYGIQFENEHDQARYMEVIGEFVTLVTSADQEHKQFWSLFMDYRL